MLEKPAITDEAIISCAQREYGFPRTRLTFLPLGYDVNTAVYRLEAQDGISYFLKLRKGPFDELVVSLPKYLSDQGLKTVIPPLETRANRLWGELDEYKLILYPFIEGLNGYETPLSETQWLAFGTALRAIHTAKIPTSLLAQIPRETYSPHWRESVKEFQVRVEVDAFDDPAAASLAAFMRAQSKTIKQVVNRAEQLAASLRARTIDFTLCHSDIHPGNLHISPGGDIYIVDWDNPLLVPKERDLNLIGGGGIGPWRSTQEGELFYKGYGPAEIDPEALSYYRYERIVVDMAEFCKQLLFTSEGGEDREQSYQYFSGQFEPGADIETAVKNDIRN
jgi:spectinomycin phosphotransferase